MKENKDKKKQKEKFELEKDSIREEIEKKLKEKYDNDLKLEINKYNNLLNKKKIEFEELNKKYNQILNLKKEEKKEFSKNKEIHNNIKCEKCFQEPIIGNRYKCSVCNNYNLCEECEEKNSISDDHPHDFIKIRKNQKNNMKVTILNNNINNFNDDDNILNEINNDDNNINEDNNILNENNSGNNINEDDNIINNDNNKIINENKKCDNIDDLNIINENKDKRIKEYSYECINADNLKAFIYEGEEAKIKIILKNNGNDIWPEDAKLIFDKESDISTEEIKLKPQKPGKEKKYNIIFKDLEKYCPNEYKSYLWFYANEKLLGEKLTLIIKIEKKEMRKNEKKKLKEFRKIYDILDKDYLTDKILLRVLKENNFNFGEAFESLHEYIK